MKIYRIDATFPGDEVERDGAIVEDVVGMLSYFCDSSALADVRSRLLVDAGWEFDSYREEIGELTPQIQTRLIESPWPVLPTAMILELCANPLASARERLDEILHSRGLPQLKAAQLKAAPPSPVSKEVPAQ